MINGSGRRRKWKKREKEKEERQKTKEVETGWRLFGGDRDKKRERVETGDGIEISNPSLLCGLKG